MAITKAVKKYQQSTIERNKQILQAFRSSNIATEVAKECNTTVDVVQRLWSKNFSKEERAKRRAQARKKKNTKKDNVKMVLDLFDSTLSSGEVAKKTSYTVSGVLRLWQSHFGKEACAKRARQTANRGGSEPSIDKERVVELLENTNSSAHEIAKEMNCCYKIACKQWHPNILQMRKTSIQQMKLRPRILAFLNNASASSIGRDLNVKCKTLLSLWRRHFGNKAVIQRSNQHRSEVSAEDIRQMNKKLEKEGYQLFINGQKLTKQTYIDSATPMTLLCPEGHKWQTQWRYLRVGHRCGKCISFTSRAEQEIADHYKNLKMIKNDRDILKGKELDLYFPEKQVAIEYCGLYWHSDANERIYSAYHREKMDNCNKKGIQLLTIFEDEWLTKKQICLSRINNALGINQKRIYARQTACKQIEKKQAKQFLEKVHLQGYGSSTIAFGLFYDDTLIQVATFGYPARQHTSKGKKILELKRLAAELNTVVVGGASKLLKRGLQYAKQNDFEYIKSYCDLCWGTGDLYKKLGFDKVYETKYTPHYANHNKRFCNQHLATNTKKEKITEAEKALILDLNKIYDCGHQTWLMTA